MAKDINAARSDLNLGFFTDSETDWVFSKLIVSQCCTEAAGLGECLHAARQIDQKSQESWVETWQSLAERVETQAREYSTLGLQESARQCFLRASTYYHAAERGALPHESRFHALWRASRNAYLSAMELSPFEFRTISVQVDDHDLPGYFIPAETGKRAPTAIIAGGNDSSLEMITALYGQAAISRGLNLFTFDHPGHRGAVHLHPECVKRPDYEVPYGKAIDVLCDQPEVTEQIGIAGLSFGGYIAPRVASHDQRIKACVASSPLVDLWETGRAFWNKLDLLKKVPASLLSALWEKKLTHKPIIKAYSHYSNWNSGFAQLSTRERLEVMEPFWRQFNLLEQLKDITCPTLALVGSDEGEELIRQAQLFYRAIGAEQKELRVLNLKENGSSDHCQLDTPQVGQAMILDWFVRVFGARPAS